MRLPLYQLFLLSACFLSTPLFCPLEHMGPIKTFTFPLHYKDFTYNIEVPRALSEHKNEVMLEEIFGAISLQTGLTRSIHVRLNLARRIGIDNGSPIHEKYSEYIFSVALETIGNVFKVVKQNARTTSQTTIERHHCYNIEATGEGEDGQLINIPHDCEVLIGPHNNRLLPNIAAEPVQLITPDLSPVGIPGFCMSSLNDFIASRIMIGNKKITAWCSTCNSTIPLTQRSGELACCSVDPDRFKVCKYLCRPLVVSVLERPPSPPPLLPKLLTQPIQQLVQAILPQVQNSAQLPHVNNVGHGQHNANVNVNLLIAPPARSLYHYFSTRNLKIAAFTASTLLLSYNIYRHRRAMYDILGLR